MNVTYVYGRADGRGLRLPRILVMDDWEFENSLPLRGGAAEERG